MDLTDEEWKVLEPLIGDMPRRAEERERMRYAVQRKATLDAWIRENNRRQRPGGR